MFGFIKKQLLEVIEWLDESKDTLIYRYPLTKRDEIMNTSTLVVRPSQAAIFVHKGEIADVFGPGTYKLSTENIPFLTKLLSLPTGFNSPIKAEVYFVSTKQFAGIKWGTQNPVMMRDADFGSVRLRGFGVYSFRVDQPKSFLKELSGTNSKYTVSDAAAMLQPIIIQAMTDSITESKISALDLAANYQEFSKRIVKQASPQLKELGIKLTNVVIENISLPEEVGKMLDERTKLGMMSDKMGTYTQMQAAQAMRDAAKNPNGSSLAGLGIGLGAGQQLGAMFAGTMNAQDKPKKVNCTKCGAEISPRAKYCPNCGAVQGEVCPKCKAPISKNAKFCPECGASLKTEKTCPKCGANMGATKKFCSECGEKLN